MKKKLLFMIALLCAMVQGVKAQNGILCTASDQGRVICTDGTIYDNVSAAQAAGKNAVAKIIWVDESSKKGLALHLADDWYYNNTAGVERCNQRNSFQPVAGATWKMASKDEWDTMVNAAGGYQQLRDGFGSVGGENLSTQSYYSSSTAYGDNKYWLYNFHDDEGYNIRHGWVTSSTDKSGHLRPCLAFDVLTLYEIKNQNDWFTFCEQVNGGDTFSDKYVKITDPDHYVPILSYMAGTDDTHSFQGIFDGNGHTLTFNGCGGFIGWGVYNKPTIKNSLMMPGSVDASMVERTFARWYVTENKQYEPTIENSYYIATTNLPTDQGKQAYTAAPDGMISRIITLPSATVYSTASTVSGIEESYNLDEGIAKITPTITDPLGASLTFGTDYTATLNGNAVTSLPLYISTTGNYALTFTGKGNYVGTKTVNFAVTGTYDYAVVKSSDTELHAGNYMVTEDVEITSRINISGNVTLILGEGQTLTAPKGIELSGSNSLTIDGTGTLLINNCDKYKSGIGAVNVGTLTINGGTINVTGGSCGAGIGGDEENTSGGTITINGGVVNATGGNMGAGIGGAYGFGGHAVCGTVTINGGQVTAIGGSNAPGIGRGTNGPTNVGSLTIGWTNPTDFVYSTVDLNNVSFAAGKAFVFDGTKTLATPSNFSGKKIVPFEAPTLSGLGSEAEPYLISTVDEWLSFAYNVYNGTNYNNEFVKLNDDISVSEMVGASDANSFQGTFLGGDNTLTFTKGTAENAFNEEYCAPFRYTNGATIKNLKVTGAIYTAQKFAAGLIACPNGTTTVTDCHVSTVIHSSKNGDGTHGGYIAYPQGNADFSDCVYDGRMFTTNGTTQCGGFVGWHTSKTFTFTNSLYAPNPSLTPAANEVAITTNCATFVRGGSASTGCYYTETIGTAQGTQVYAALPSNEICKTLTISNVTVYMIPACTVSDVEESYLLSESPSITPVVTYNENELTFATDYTATLDGVDVESFPVSPIKVGTYTLVLTGTGDYAGAKIVEFMVLPSPTENFTLTDASTYDFKSDVNVASATYKNTTDRVRKFHSWLVLFDYTITAADLQNFDFYKINMIANAPNPQTNVSDDVWVFLKQIGENDVLHANMPYVYKPKVAVTDYAFTTNNAVLKAKADDARITMMTAEDTYTIYATYAPTTATAADPFYYVNIDGTISYGDAVTVGAFRWIMRAESKFGGATPAYAREIHFFDGESDVTGITTTNFTNYTNSDAWYTIDGRKLDSKPAAKGIYVNNGRKVVVK